MSDDYFDIKEISDLAAAEDSEMFFIAELKKADIWCKVDDFIPTKQVVKWKDRPYLDIYRIAIKCYGTHTGWCYLVVSEKIWKRAIRSAKNLENTDYHIISKHNPWVHMKLNHINCKQYKINVIESFRTEVEFKLKLNMQKQNDLW